MEIITADDIRHSGADNLPDILRFVAGVDVRKYGMTGWLRKSTTAMCRRWPTERHR